MREIIKQKENTPKWNTKIFFLYFHEKHGQSSKEIIATTKTNELNMKMMIVKKENSFVCGCDGGVGGEDRTMQILANWSLNGKPKAWSECPKFKV